MPSISKSLESNFKVPIPRLRDSSVIGGEVDDADDALAALEESGRFAPVAMVMAMVMAMAGLVA